MMRGTKAQVKGYFAIPRPFPSISRFIPKL
jgi:hypothetical protein